jgi:hypothetical protein
MSVVLRPDITVVERLAIWVTVKEVMIEVIRGTPPQLELFLPVVTQELVERASMSVSRASGVMRGSLVAAHSFASAALGPRRTPKGVRTASVKQSETAG